MAGGQGGRGAGQAAQAHREGTREAGQGARAIPSTAPFSNKTDWTLRKVYEEDHTLLEENFRAYINGFSKNVDDIIEHFNYRATIGLMVKNNRLAPILNQYKELELGPDKLSPLEMGYIYEELLRRFSEQSGEEAGEHFTPREVIRLMVELLDIPIPDRHLSIYDPACGTGGMLSVAKEHLLDRAATPAEKAQRREVRDRPRRRSCRRRTTPSARPTCSSRTTSRPRCILGNSLIPHDPHSQEPGDQFPEPKFRFDFMLSAIRRSASPGAARTATRPRRASWRRPAIRPGCRA